MYVVRPVTYTLVFLGVAVADTSGFFPAFPPSDCTRTPAVAAMEANSSSASRLARCSSCLLHSKQQQISCKSNTVSRAPGRCLRSDVLEVLDPRTLDALSVGVHGAFC